MIDSPRCKCGHRKYDHFLGSCDSGNKLCRCMGFTPEPEPTAGETGGKEHEA